MDDISDVEIIAPNFKHRLSGVTSTIIQLIPVQRALGQKVAVLGPGLPASLPHIGYTALAALWRRPKNRALRVCMRGATSRCCRRSCCAISCG